MSSPDPSIGSPGPAQPADFNEASMEISRLKAQNLELQDKLDHCRAKIMQLQEDVEIITDAEIKQKFERLCSTIQEWVAKVELDLMRQSPGFRKEFQRNLESETDDSLVSMLHLPHMQAGKGSRKRKEKSRSKSFGLAKELAELDICFNYVLSRFIWWNLEMSIFNFEYPFGMHHEIRTALEYTTMAIEGDADGASSLGS
ncbi:hypothetical protein N7466_009481 [Penicillium verhagenii]|uniref:uncharacterized protein n=1 Tax=Penicillium verhagenii TaxID=1562060 RepID=UPI0025450034|nr:uncharacterized protein N7466_009481 [Penicillium verhagenii]KAJ5921155.1 hypothetical protein N7466_009481 [Penicillium verhagenii]